VNKKSKYQNRDSRLETSGKIVGFYEREFYCFSNFSSFAVRWKGRLWQTSEHAYQASRFMGKNPSPGCCRVLPLVKGELKSNPKVVEQVFKALSADAAYKIAQKALGGSFDDYGESDLKFMEDILRNKLCQNPYVMHKLLQTGKKKIVEDSPKDSFWGWGLDRKGRNELGKIWIKLRKEL
jgi:hypothetical protein